MTICHSNKLFAILASSLLWLGLSTSLLHPTAAIAQFKPCFSLVCDLAEPVLTQPVHAHPTLAWLTLDSLKTSMPQARTYIQPGALKVWALKQDFWFTRDKVQHFAACFFITFSSRIAATALLNFDHQAATTMAGGMGAFIGFMREVIDDYQDNNIFSSKDMAANLLGVLLALVCLAFI